MFTCPDKLACEDSALFNTGYNVAWVKNAKTSQFTPNVPTIFLIHGWDSWATYWETDMRNELMQHYNGNVNVVQVDWRDGANQTYPEAAGNARIVGKQIANIAENLMNDETVALSDIIIVGHSLGAQVAGYVGKEFTKSTGQKIGRIDALDPTALMFPSSNETETPGYDVLLLTKNDADFVQVIHTTGRYGVNLIAVRNPLGHVDFYPNAGAGFLDGYQGGCSGDPSCNHSRSYLYYKRSINSPQCYHAKSDHKETNTMGFHAVKPQKDIEYFLTVSLVNPFSFIPVEDGCGIYTST